MLVVREAVSTISILSLNIAHRTHVATETGSIFDGGSLEVRSGPPPGADNVAAGALIAVLAVSNPAFAVAGDGSVESASNWTGTATGTGVPGHYRLISADAQEVREGDAAESPGSGEIMLFSGLIDGQIIGGGVVTIAAGGYALTQSATEAALLASFIELPGEVAAGSTTPLSVLLYSSLDTAEDPEPFEVYDAARYIKTVLSGDATLGGANGDELIAGATAGGVVVEFVHVEFGTSTGPIEINVAVEAPPYTIQYENLPAEIVEGASFGDLLVRTYNVNADVVQTLPWVEYSVLSGPGSVSGVHGQVLAANPNSAPATIVVRATYMDALTVSNSPLDGNVSVIADTEPPPLPGGGLEPSGMTQVMLLDGSTFTLPPQFGIGSGWSAHTRFGIVADSQSKYGSVLEKRALVGDPEGWNGVFKTTGGNGSLMDFRQVYVRFVVKYSSNYQAHPAGEKLIYIGRRFPGQNPRSFTIGRRGNRLKFVNDGDGQSPLTVTGSLGPDGSAGGTWLSEGVSLAHASYITIEFLWQVNTQGNNDGFMRARLNGVEVPTWSHIHTSGPTTGLVLSSGVRWKGNTFFTNDVGSGDASKGIEGMQIFHFWGGNGSPPKAVNDSVRLSELYISGKN